MIKEIFRKASINFLIRIIGSMLGLVLSILLARHLGASNFGDYSLALAIITVASTFSRFGLDNSIIRFTAIEISKESWQGALYILKSSLLMALLGGVFSGFLLYLFIDTIALNINKPNLGVVLHNVVYALPLLTISIILAQFLFGIKRSVVSQLILTLIVPLFLVVFMLVSGYDGVSLNGISIAYTSAVFLSVVIGIYGVVTFVSTSFSKPSNYDFTAFLRSSYPLYVSSIFSNLTQWSSIIIIGVWLTSSDVGVFSVAQKIVAMISFIQVAFNSITAPVFSSLFYNNELVKLKNVAQKTTLTTILISVPILLCIIVQPGLVLGYYGADFSDKGSLILRIMLVGQIINIVTGPSGFLLMMSGNENSFKNTTIIGGGVAIVLNISLIPLMGLVGAALALSCSVIIVNVLNATKVKKKLGFWSFY